MAAPSLEVRIRRDLGGADWLECEDASGIFYYSRQTKTASLEPPPKVLSLADALSTDPLYVSAQPPVVQQAVVLMRVGNWVVAEDNLGVFYQDIVSLKSYDEPPPELIVLLQKKREAEERQLRRQQRQEMQQELRRKWEQQYGQQGQQCQDTTLQMQRIQPHHSASPADPVQSTKEAIVKMRVANWAIAQDSLGEFYQNMVTGESFDVPPAELLHILRQRVGSTTAQAQHSQIMPTWHDLAAQAQSQYRSWPSSAAGIHLG
mmetsp:Transcript_9819/g.21961  ORF Transcript_9819/g.21961 Transcript_9819/m.21961 type:complete len:261 (-) Transcript_9819:93-875(-)